MSIKGIDSQIMITRAPDFVNEAAAQLKGGERAQEFLAAQAQAQAEILKSSTPRTEETPKAELHTEDNGKSQDGYEPPSDRGRLEEEAEESLLDADVGPADNTIDILL